MRYIPSLNETFALMRSSEGRHKVTHTRCHVQLRSICQDACKLRREKEILLMLVSVARESCVSQLKGIIIQFLQFIRITLHLTVAQHQNYSCRMLLNSDWGSVVIVIHQHFIMFWLMQSGRLIFRSKSREMQWSVKKGEKKAPLFWLCSVGGSWSVWRQQVMGFAMRR